MEPAKQLPIDGGCLEGTRKTVLSNVEVWLKSSDMPNVLWVSAAPGAGKTALASTIVDNLLRDTSYESYDCAKFFIKRAESGLRDPRMIWRSIAFQLAEMYRGVKVDILDVMAGQSGRIYPGDAKVKDQFRQLIYEPLKKHFSSATASRKIVIIIDALDECDESHKEDVREFLETIVE